MLEKTLENPLDSKEIKPVNPKGSHPWIFIGRANAEAEAPILWSPDVKSSLTGKDPNVGKNWGQQEKGTTEDEMVGWQHWLNGHEFEQAPGDCEGQGSLDSCSPRGSQSQTQLSDWTTPSPGKPQKWLIMPYTHQYLANTTNVFLLFCGFSDLW